MKTNRPLTLRSHNLIDLSILRRILIACLDLPHGVVYRAVFLTGFFAFLRHLTGHDVFFSKKNVKILITWSKTLQTRDKVQCTTLPKLHNPQICPFRALKELFPMSSHSSLFQLPSSSGSSPLTDSRVRKTLKLINIKLGFHSAYFTFHDFRRSGATFAFNSNVPIQDIKRHGTWSSDCVWQYIQSDHSSGESIAVALAAAVNNA